MARHNDLSRIGWVTADDASLSIVRQCRLADISRATWYRRLIPKEPDEKEVALRDAIDRIYTACPYYGEPRITAQLHRDGFIVNHKRIERIMRDMGLQALFPRRNGSARHPLHPVYPYLLRDVPVTHPNHVWGTDITYIRCAGHWLYLDAILDWYSRYILAWRLSDLMTADICAEALEEALAIGTPDIHNSDQGSHYTSDVYTNVLKTRNIPISMDGRGRCFDNIFTERLWRTIKYEEVYVKRYESLTEAKDSLSHYIRHYNAERLHSSLDYKTPAEVYFEGR